VLNEENERLLMVKGAYMLPLNYFDLIMAVDDCTSTYYVIARYLTNNATKIFELFPTFNLSFVKELTPSQTALTNLLIGHIFSLMSHLFKITVPLESKGYYCLRKPFTPKKSLETTFFPKNLFHRAIHNDICDT
jgi:hypothetical protein